MKVENLERANLIRRDIKSLNSDITNINTLKERITKISQLGGGFDVDIAKEERDLFLLILESNRQERIKKLENEFADL